MTLVFVYGTLKGMKNRFGTGSGLQKSEFVGHGLTKGLFNLADGPYPIAIPASHSKAKETHQGHITGEVYAVQPQAVTSLDAYESYPDLYDRQLYDVVLGNGATVKAWIYTGNQAADMIGGPGRQLVKPNDVKTLYWHFPLEVALTKPATKEQSSAFS